MINKQDIIRFVEGIELEKLKSAMVFVTDDKSVCHYIDGSQTKLAAALVLLARKDPDFKAVLIAAAEYSEMEGGEE